MRTVYHIQRQYKLVFHNNALRCSKSKEEFEAWYREMTERWGTTNYGLVDYLNKIWLCDKEKLVSYLTDQHFHFGNRVAKRVKMAYWLFKNNSTSALYHLDTCLVHINKLLMDQYPKLRASLEYSRVSAPSVVKNIPIFSLLLGKVSRKCIYLMYSTWSYFCSGKYRPKCTECYVRRSFGIPCVHEMASIVREGRVFLEADVHVFWRQIHGLGETFNHYHHVEDLRMAIELNSFTKKEITLSAPMWRMFKDPKPVNYEAVMVANRKGILENDWRNSSLEYSRDEKDKETKDRKKKDENKKKKYPPVVVGGYDFGTNNFECFIVPHVLHVENVQSDGNCGFRSLAVLLGFEEDQWPHIRIHMVRELYDHPERYTLLLPEGSVLEDYIARVNWLQQGVMAPSDHWMEMPLCGVLFATIYQCTLVYLDWLAPHTSLPLIRQEPILGAPPPNTILFLCRDELRQHFLPIACDQECPMPPVLPAWFALRDESVAGIGEQYASRIEMFKNFRHQND